MGNNKLTLRGKKLNLLIPEEEIKKKVSLLGELINDYFPKNEPLIVVGLLKGSFVFVSDLVRAINRPTLVDFMVASSYRGTQSSGNVQIKKDLDFDIKGKNVLLVDDILDTGRTFKKVLELLTLREPKILKTCVLLDKPSRRVVPIEADFVGFKIPDLFVVGYGLDWDELGRNLPSIYFLSEEG
ncbi:MAG: hypoxanthine phosphoribosyltransferase [Aquificae bacterium]|nr:hypoxanthine phosphoribosyltransferase [Aquificota bacterium]